MDAKRGFVPEDERNFSPEAISTLGALWEGLRDHVRFHHPGSLRQLGKPDSRVHGT